jgi:hypothetical protein
MSSQTLNAVPYSLLQQNVAKKPIINTLNFAFEFQNSVVTAISKLINITMFNIIPNIEDFIN